MGFLIQVAMRFRVITTSPERQCEIVIEDISKVGILAAVVGEGVQDVGIETQAL